MRIKKFTLLTLALLMMSVVAFAQSPSLSLPITFGFNDGTMQGWTTIDADGDGHCWEMGSSPTFYFDSGISLNGTGHNSSQDFVLSGSFSNVIMGALTPDNYLVSPLVPLGGSIVFYACAQDAGYAAEHFGVAVSTTSNTDPTAFTTIWESTMTASRANAPKNGNRSPRRAQGRWYQYTVDLSAYAGQNGYVAIRHFNCTDQFVLNIDDITLIGPEGLGELVVLPNGVKPVTYYTTGGTFYGITDSGWLDDTSSMPSIQVAIDGSDIYIQGLAYFFKDAWIKGTIENGIATFASGQYVGTDDWGIEFLVGSNDGNTVAPIIFALDEDAGTLTAQTTYIYESNQKNEISADSYSYWESAEFSVIVEIPEGLETSEYSLSAYEVTWGQESNDPTYTEYETPVMVGFDGNTVYAQGLCAEMPEAWVKGTISGTTVTFRTGQFLGIYEPFAGYFQYPMYLLGYDGSGIEDITFELGEANATLTMTSPDYILINTTKNTVDPYTVIAGAVLTLLPDVAATPAQPEIYYASLTGNYPKIEYSIPIEDEDGNPLILSKLTYQVYVDINQVVSPLTLTTGLYEELDDDMTEIPYNFTDNYDVYNYRLYLNQGDFTGWRRIGIQSIYRGGSEEKRSEINWYALYNYMVSVPADGYATYYIDDVVTLDAASIEAGAELLTVTAATEDAVTISALDVAASNTPLLIYNGGEKKIIVKLIPTDAPEEMPTVAPAFKGTLQDLTFNDAEMNRTNHYVLNENNFVWVCEAGTIEANRCWLEFGTHVKTAPILKIVRNGDATGINNVNANLNSNYYNLQGRKLNGTPSKAGIYIQNGKKIVIK